MAIAVSQLYVLGILRLQIGIAGLVGILIQEEQKGIQVLISRPVDPPSIVQGELVLVVEVVAEKSCREQVHIAPGKRGVLVDHRDAIAQLVPGIIGILEAHTDLRRQLFVLFGHIHIGCVDVLVIKEMIGLGGVYLRDIVDEVIISGRIIGIYIAQLDTRF